MFKNFKFSMKLEKNHFFVFPAFVGMAYLAYKITFYFIANSV
jgi:hypothetical protein